MNIALIIALIIALRRFLAVVSGNIPYSATSSIMFAGAGQPRFDCAVKLVYEAVANE
jgi:hypothetical protein